MKNKNESVENNQQEEVLKTPQKVSKKRKVIAVAATASVVLAAGVGIGVGVGIYNRSKPKPALVKFVSDADTITKVYNDKGQLVNVSSLQVGDRVCFPSPKITEIDSGDETEYFAGWATKSRASEPEYYVGEDFITITGKIQSFYPVYMKATTEVLTFEEVAESNLYTVKINSAELSDQKIVVVPNQYNGNAISSIIERTDSATANDSIERIIIAKGVEEIGENAFTNLTALKNVTFTTDSYSYMVETETGELASVTIPTSSQTELTTIAKNAFKGDTALETISIPASVTSIGDTAFQNCSSLKYVNFTRDSELETIANNTFNGCSSLAKFELPASVKSIGNGTFVNCTSMKEFSVLLDSNGKSALKSIDGFAFYKSGIESMDLSKCSNLTSISGKYDEATQSWTKEGAGIWAFAYCPNLKEIKLPSSVQFIGETAFINCPELTTVEIPYDSALACPIDRWFDTCPKLESIFIPKGITSIYYHSFYGCSALTSVEFHPECTLENQSSGGTEVFMNSGITSIALPSGWTTIDERTFAGCSSLESITFSPEISTIKQSAFSGAGLKKVIIPSSVTSVGYRAFWTMPKLEEIRFESETLSVGNEAFQAPYYGESFVDANENGVYDEGEEFTDVNGNGVYDSLIPSKLTTITFADSVKSVTFSDGSYSTFLKCKNIDTIIFEKSITDSSEAPTVDLSKILTDTEKTVTIYVPADSVDAYKSAFADYADKIVAASSSAE